MALLRSVDPRTGEATGIEVPETSPEGVDAVVQAAALAAAPYEAAGRGLRIRLLRAIATALEDRRSEIVALAVRETGLAEARLHGELTRSVFQAGFFADVVADGGYLEATIDHPVATPTGPAPDLRRMLVPLGPVAVFGASNFPLAFSVPGGDTMSALAAGCPVVLKAHDSHLGLSQLTFEAVTDAAAAVGAPSGLVGLVFGIQAGTRLVGHPEIRAVGFTGSLAGGRALMRIAESRPDPVPFYGELSSLNPVVITAAAIDARGEEIAEGLVGSVVGSGGQLCTKPGLVLVPDGPSGDRLVELVSTQVAQLPPSTLLNEGISRSYRETLADLEARAGIRVLARGHGDAPGFAVLPQLLQVDAAALPDLDIEECFGPATVIARYPSGTAAAAIAELPGSLAAAIHAEAGEDDLVAELVAALRPRTGRVLFDGWPTGVQVAWAQHHGGPWPATNTAHTSVGAAAIRRFLRPMCWQNAPAAVLPPELRDELTGDDAGLVRRVDGRLG